MATAGLIVFYYLAAASIASAILAITRRKPIHSLLWVLAPEDLDVRAALVGTTGHATMVRASDAAKARWGVFHPEPAPIAAIAAGLRTRFDPHRILNPGRMAGTG